MADSPVDTALGEDASGRPFAELLTTAADMLAGYGGGPVADCLRIKADEVSAALASVPSRSPDGLTEALERITVSNVRQGDVLEIGYVSPQFGHTTVRREVVAILNDGEIILHADDHGNDYVWKHPEKDAIRLVARSTGDGGEQG